jgi:hydrogenase nickel incorporation protein HypB
MTRIVEVRRNLLKKNDVAAAALRERFREAGTTVVSLVSSPGAGKTALLEHTLRHLARTSRVAALVGDLATDRDAQRLARSGARVKQITTGTVCHLDGEMVEAALGDWELRAIDYLFIENVGNLVCPASYDLGEQMRCVLMSVTEGEDKPLKYPTIFNSADVAVITKIDLADIVGFRRDEAYGNIAAVRPGLEIVETSARQETGLVRWFEHIQRLRGGTPRSIQPVQNPDSDSDRDHAQTGLVHG